MKRLVEIRTYRLKAGSSGLFQELASQVSIPMCKEFGMDVVGFGPAGEEDMWFFVRAFDSEEHLKAQQDEFYSSEAWIDGPRQGIVALIEEGTNALLNLNVETIEAIRRDLAESTGNQLEVGEEEMPDW